jgi:hypothetical protein
MCRPTMRATCGRSEPNVADVIVEVKIRVIDPVRVIEAERNLSQTPAHGFEVANHVAEALVHMIERFEVR